MSKARSKADRHCAQVATALDGFYGLLIPNYSRKETMRRGEDGCPLTIVIVKTRYIRV